MRKRKRYARQAKARANISKNVENKDNDDDIVIIESPDDISTASTSTTISNNTDCNVDIATSVSTYTLDASSIVSTESISSNNCGGDTLQHGK